MPPVSQKLHIPASQAGKVEAFLQNTLMNCEFSRQQIRRQNTGFLQSEQLYVVTTSMGKVNMLMTIGLPHQLRTIIFRSVGDVEVGIKGFAYLLQSKPYCPLCNRSVARNMNDFDGFTAVTACKTTHHFTFYAICVPIIFTCCSVNYQPSSWRMHQNTYMGQSVSAKFCYQTTLQTCSSSEYEIF